MRDELLEEVDARKLEEWEPGDVIARPMVLLCRVIDATDGDRATRRTLYPRVCRLDPVAAMRLPAE